MQRNSWKKKVVEWLPGSVIDRLDLPNAGYRLDRSTWLLRDQKKSDTSTLKDEMSSAFVCAATSYIIFLPSCFFSSDYRYTPRELNNLLNEEFRASWSYTSSSVFLPHLTFIPDKLTEVTVLAF